MKKLSIYILSIVQIAPFAFWKLEGPFIGQFNSIDNCSPSQTMFKKYNHNFIYQPQNYFTNFNIHAQYITFYYDQNTHYLFSFSATNKLDILEKNVLFLLNNTFPYDNDFFVTQIPLTASQKFPHTSFLTNGIVLLPSFKHFEPLTSPYRFFSLNQRISIDSGIEIINPSFNEPKNIDLPLLVSKTGKQIYFQNALKKYFYHDNHYTALATAITQFKYADSKKLFAYEVSKAVNNITKIREKETERLNNSTILAIYSVLRGKDNKNSIVFGLAQDNTTENKERFFWFTDLENDISVLLDQ